MSGNGPRRHYCGVFKNDSEQLSTVVPFLLDGIRRNDRCVVITDRVDETTLLEHMMKATSVDEDVLHARISFLHSDDAYLRGGRFEAERMLRFVADAREESLRLGYAGLTATGEMTWASKDAPGASELMDYEARINFMYPESSADILCQYPESEFDPATLVNAIRTHPRVIVRGTVCGNPYYMPPDMFTSYAAGSVTSELVERMEKELFSRAVMSEIESVEARELKRVRICLKSLDEMVLDDLHDRLVAVSFLHELALDTCKDDPATAHIRSADERCKGLVDRLEALRSFRMCMEAPAEWLSLEETMRRAVDIALDGSRKAVLDLGLYRILASTAADKAFAAVLAEVAARSPASSRIEAHAEDTQFGLTVTVGAAGRGVPEGAKESLFSVSEPCVCGRSLYLSREVLDSTGISLREVGVPGRSTVFEVHVPVSKYRVA